MEEEEAATSDGSYTWSDTSLILEARCLEHAKETFLGLYRQQLSTTMLLAIREQGGRVGGMRRRLANRPWTTLQEVARQHLQGAPLEQWRDYEFRSTHEWRPRNRRPAPMDD